MGCFNDPAWASLLMVVGGWHTNYIQLAGAGSKNEISKQNPVQLCVPNYFVSLSWNQTFTNKKGSNSAISMSIKLHNLQQCECIGSI